MAQFENEGLSTLVNRVPQEIIALLEEGLQATRMKTAMFRAGEHITSADDTFTETVREKTGLYRSTWVESPLMVALAYLKGEISLAQAQRYWGVNDTLRPGIDQDIREPMRFLEPQRFGCDA